MKKMTKDIESKQLLMYEIQGKEEEEKNDWK
jgi:hypothetical protein